MFINARVLLPMILLLPFSAVVAQAQASKAPECKVRVLLPIVDDLGNAWQPGQVLPVDIERDDARGGAYCATGGSCIPRTANGKPAVTMLNCEVGPPIDTTDHKLTPNAHVVGQATAHAMLKRGQVAEKLEALGFSNASAGTLANDYIDRPASPSGRLVTKALAGSSEALAILKKNNP